MIFNVTTYGAVGDGVTDDSAAIQAAIDAANLVNGGRVVSPYAKYKLNTPLQGYSNITLELDDSTLDFSDAVGTTYAIHGTGSYGTEYNIAANRTRGDKSFTTTVAHDFVPGDIVLIRSQRNCISSDAGDDWRLGYGTPSIQDSYFAEYLTVATVPTSTTFTTINRLIFPDYRIDDSLETSAYARARTTVKKVNFLENFIVRNGTILHGEDIKGGVYLNIAKESYVRSVSFDMGDWRGAATTFNRSLYCEGYDLKAKTSAVGAIDALTDIGYNHFKAINSSHTGFKKCTDENGAQSFDLTYSSDGDSFVGCYIKDFTAINPQQALTTHPGGYQCKLNDIDIINPAKNALGIRSRKSIVNNVKIIGANTADNTYGIYLYEGWAQETTISNCIVEGMKYAYAVVDAGDTPEKFKRVNSVFANNIADYCDYAFAIIKGSLAFATDSGLIIKNNIIKNGGAIFSNNYCNGVTFESNKIYKAPDTGINIVDVAANCRDWKIKDNDFIDCGLNNTAIKLRAITDTTTFPSGLENWVVEGNRYIGDIGVTESIAGNMLGGYTPPQPIATESQAYFDACAVEPTEVRKNLLNNLIISLKDSGIWANIGSLQIYAAHTEQAGLVDLKNPLHSATNQGATFTTDRGFKGNGSSTYIETGITPTSVGASQDDISFGVWTKDGTDSGLMALGEETGTAVCMLYPKTGTGRIGGRISTTSSSTDSSVANRNAFTALDRSGSTQFKAYRNGSPVVTLTATSTHSPNRPLLLLRSTTGYADDKVLVFYCGTSLTGTQHTALYNALNTYLTAIGAL